MTDDPYIPLQMTGNQIPLQMTGHIPMEEPEEPQDEEPLDITLEGITQRQLIIMEQNSILLNVTSELHRLFISIDDAVVKLVQSNNQIGASQHEMWTTVNAAFQSLRKSPMAKMMGGLGNGTG